VTDLTQLIDTVPSLRYPVYTRLNAGDVMPDPITPLGAMLVWIPEVLPIWARYQNAARLREEEPPEGQRCLPEDFEPYRQAALPHAAAALGDRRSRKRPHDRRGGR
jgi:hypothetical protein